MLDMVQFNILRPFQIISLFLVNLIPKNLPGNQEKNGAMEKNELLNPTEKQLMFYTTSHIPVTRGYFTYFLWK